MAKSKKPKKKTDEEIGLENELLKLKMMAEFGGEFVGSDQIPPEVENIFLKQIGKLHRAQNSAEMTTVYDLIGRPEYNSVHDLSDKEVTRELKKMTRLLRKFGIGLAVLNDEIKPREVYRFITQELFKHEVQKVNVKGWTTQFIYEDFHPNDEFDVKSTARTVSIMLFSKGGVFLEQFFAEEMKDRIGLSMEPEELLEKAESYQSQWNGLGVLEIETRVSELDLENNTASAISNIEVEGQTEKGKRWKKFETVVEINLVRNAETKVWEVKQVINDLIG